MIEFFPFGRGGFEPHDLRYFEHAPRRSKVIQTYNEHKERAIEPKVQKAERDPFRRRIAILEALAFRGILRNTVCRRNHRSSAERLPQSLPRVANKPNFTLDYSHSRNHMNTPLKSEPLKFE